MLTLVSDSPLAARQRAATPPDPALAGRRVMLSNHDADVLGRATVAAIDGHTLTLTDIREFSPTDQHRRQGGGPTLETQADPTATSSRQTRPEQEEFRRLVLAAHQGRCALSGCDVEPALDAAHLPGRDWRFHNQASDGILLRADLHKLLDAGLLTLTADGRARFAPAALPHYQEWQDAPLRRP